MTPMGDIDPLQPWSDATGYASEPNVEIIHMAAYDERQRILALIEEIRVSPQWSGQQADWLCEVISGEIRDGRTPLAPSAKAGAR